MSTKLLNVQGNEANGQNCAWRRFVSNRRTLKLYNAQLIPFALAADFKLVTRTNDVSSCYVPRILGYARRSHENVAVC